MWLDVTDKICSFFGHRKIDKTEELIAKTTEVIENLINNENVTTFLFGSKSEFDDLCYDIVSELKEKYTHIQRIYVRAEFEYIDGEGCRAYKEGLLARYEDTYYPEHMLKAGKSRYVERNQEMINKSDICVFFYDKNYMPPRRRNCKRDLFDYQPKSGTGIAYNYAIAKKDKKIINIFE